MEEACKSLKLVRFFIFFSAKFFFSQIFLRGEGLSHRFHRYTQIFFIMIFLHRISRMIGGILAYRITHGFSQNFGRWPMARALYMLLLFFVTQISLMTQIFLRWRVLSHRFHRFTQIFYGISGESLCPISGGYLQRPDRSHLRKSVSNRRSRKSQNKFRGIR